MLYITLALALAPGIAISLFVIRRDKHNREPNALLLVSFLLGMLSVGPAIIGEALVSGITGLHVSKNPVITFLYAFVNIAFIEEFCKLFFVMIFAFPRKAFDEPFDGITYAVMVGMGFATLENIMYVWEGGLSVAVARMLTAVPAHATFGILMGYFLGLYKFKPARFGLFILSILVPTVFHGFYDFFLMMNNKGGLFLGALVSLIVAVVLSFRAMRIHRRNSPFNRSVIKADIPAADDADDINPGGAPAP